LFCLTLVYLVIKANLLLTLYIELFCPTATDFVDQSGCFKNILMFYFILTEKKEYVNIKLIKCFFFFSTLFHLHQKKRLRVQNVIRIKWLPVELRGK